MLFRSVLDLFSSSLHLRTKKTSSKTLGFSTRTSTTKKSMNKTFAVLTTLFCVHAAHGHSTNAEAFALLKLYRHTHPSSVSLIHHRAHRNMREHRQGRVHDPSCVYDCACARVSAFSARPPLHRAVWPSLHRAIWRCLRQADPDAAGKAIARDCPARR